MPSIPFLSLPLPALLLTALPLIAAGAGAQEVYVDYDTATAFSQLKTFRFVATGEDLSRSAPDLHRQIAEAIVDYLVEAKLEEVPSEPDIYVTYHASTRERFTLGAVVEYVYADNWAWGNYWDVYGTRSARVVTSPKARW